MIRKLVIVFAAFAVILGGFAPRGGALLSMAEALGNPMAMMDCASMMEIGSNQDSADCAEMNDEGGPDQPFNCAFKDCSLRSGPVPAFQISASFITYSVAVGLPELRLDGPTYASAASTPPLRPPCSSILA